MIIPYEYQEILETSTDYVGSRIQIAFSVPSLVKVLLLGEQEHPEVVAAVEACLAAASAAGKPAGVNAFVEARARHYLSLGASFVLVGADVALLARASEDLAKRFLD